jgi:hypothetical protein
MRLTITSDPLEFSIPSYNGVSIKPSCELK